MLGLLGILLFNAKKLSDYVKENIGFTIFLKENAKQADIVKLQKKLDATRYVKATEFISKEDAADILKEDLGEDFTDFLGYNPLSASIDVKLYARYANPDSLVHIEKDFQTYPEVNEIFYQKSLVHLVNENIQKISLIILSFSGLLLLIALTLINNTIRLSVYNKRFIINTMKLVGATRGFIRRPMLLKGALHGVYAAFIAVLMLTGVLYFIQQEFSQMLELMSVELLSMLFAMVFVLGILINWVSTFFAVNKFLRMDSDSLYYYH
jgi:cell division transport system permease protein